MPRGRLCPHAPEPPRLPRPPHTASCPGRGRPRLPSSHPAPTRSLKPPARLHRQQPLLVWKTTARIEAAPALSAPPRPGSGSSRSPVCTCFPCSFQTDVLKGKTPHSVGGDAGRQLGRRPGGPHPDSTSASWPGGPRDVISPPVLVGGQHGSPHGREPAATAGCGPPEDFISTYTMQTFYLLVGNRCCCLACPEPQGHGATADMCPPSPPARARSGPWRPAAAEKPKNFFLSPPGFRT